MALTKIRTLMKVRGLTSETLGDMTGVPKSTIDKIASGHSDNPGFKIICKLAHGLNLTVDELVDLLDLEVPSVSVSLSSTERILAEKYRALDEHGKDLVSTILEKEFARCSAALVPAPAVPNNIRSFGGCFPNFGYASAGTGTMAQEEPLDWSYEFDPPKGATCTITIKGNSMEPRFSDGETVWVDTTKLVEPGQIGVFVINGEAYCKKFVRDEKGPRLVSLNPAYDPIVLSEDDDVRLFGRVIGK